jgi:hypothetical protein
VLEGDYETVSSIYNGKFHRELAAKNGWKPYPDKLKEAEEQFKKLVATSEVVIMEEIA